MSGSDESELRASSANAEVARLFAEIGDILELKGEPPYRYHAYRTAARNVGNVSERLEDLFAQGRLREIQGVGQALEAKIVEYLATGRMEAHERELRDFPIALTSLLRVPGLGPGKARTLYRELGISSVAELEQAARGGRLREVAGFGARAEQTVLANLERLQHRSDRGLLSDAWVGVAQVREALGRASDDDRLAAVGSVRRMQDSVGNLDLLAAADSDSEAERYIETLVSLPNLVQIVDRQAESVTVRLYGGLDVRLFLVPRAAWGSALVWYTGSGRHVERLQHLATERGWRLGPRGLEEQATGKRLGGEREAGIYESLGLQWIPPELREDEGEIEAASLGTLPKLIELSDIRGDLHTHTNWTDGTETLEDMAKAARARGYQYIALTDHTHNLAMTRGLTPERIAEQRNLVNRVNHKLAPFVVLHGTEMDILLDGRLDLPDEVLHGLDYVSVSVHTGFTQPKETMTQRMTRAISNPLVTTLNHPHGRKVGIREGYAVDMQAVIEHAARGRCALELNATPNRLDLNGTWARRALRLGARFTISSDAHAAREFDYMQFGVGSARRGWLTTADVLNARPLDELLNLLAEGRPQ